MKRPAAPSRVLVAFVLGFWSLANVGCSPNSTKNRYILAERLWTDGKYSAAVNEFDRVTAQDTQGKLGLQALFRSATTETLFLGQHDGAYRKFKTYLEQSADEATRWEARRQMGEILFEKTEQYDAAIRHFREMIKARPKDPEVPEFLYKIGRSQFFLWRFDEAIDTYREVYRLYPESPYAERAMFEIGVTQYTRGEHGLDRDAAVSANDIYQQAIQAYQQFLSLYPRSTRRPEALFGIAACHEEMDQIDLAYQEYEALRTAYPSPNVVEVKLARLKQRKSQKIR